jgi:hypothetical protein
MKFPISAAIAIAFGLIVLLGYFVGVPLLATLRDVFVQWALILAAIALLVGVGYLLSVHWRNVTSRRPGGFYSVIMLISLVVTLLVAGYFGPTGTWSLWLFNYVQTPLEASLMALLSVVLAMAGIRLLRRRVNLFSLVFLGTALIMLLGSAPILGVEIPGLHGPGGLRALISQIPVTAGARGILLGVALGTVATGLRILIGADRP